MYSYLSPLSLLYATANYTSCFLISYFSYMTWSMVKMYSIFIQEDPLLMSSHNDYLSGSILIFLLSKVSNSSHLDKKKK